MSIAWPAQGTTLGIDESGINANGTYTLINGITSMSNLAGGEVGERDTTVLTSTVKTSAPTIPDNQEATFDLNHDPTDTVHKLLATAKNVPVAFFNFQATYNTGNTNSSSVFAAWVKAFDGPNADDVDSNLTSSFTLRKTGAVNSTP